MTRVALFSLIALTFAACSQGPTALDSSSPRARLEGAGAHFQSPSVCNIPNSGVLRCSIDEAGIGNGVGTVRYELSAHFDALFACINGGRKNPSAANKRSVQGDARGGASLAVHNGRAQGFVLTSPAPNAGTFDCPPGQTEAFIAVQYSSIALTDVTNNVSQPNIGPDPICRDDFSVFSGIASCPAPF